MPHLSPAQLQLLRDALQDSADAPQREAARALLAQLEGAAAAPSMPLLHVFLTPPDDLDLAGARAALSAAQRLLRNSSLGIVGMRMPPWHGEIQLVNPTAALLLGGSQAALRGQRLVDIFELDEAELEQVVQTADEQARSVYMEIKRRDEGASMRWCGCNVHAIHRDGALVGAIAVLRDITTQMELGRKLREGERLLEAIERASLLPLCVLDERGAHVLVNEAYCALLGWPREELLGHHHHMVVPEALRREISAAYHGALDGLPTRGDWTLMRRGGELVEVHIKSARAVDERGHKMLVCSVQDMTAPRQQEALRAQLDQRLAHHQKLESLGLLAGGIAHDFNNIMTVMQANMVLLEEIQEAEVRAEIVDDMRDASQRAAGLIRTLSAYAGHHAAMRRAHDLRLLVEETVRLLWTALGRKQTCSVRLPDGPLVAELDPSQLQQVLIHLIMNAQEASAQVEWPVEIRLEQRRIGATSGLLDVISGSPVEPGLYAALSVRDWGVGMTPEQQTRVFDPFYTTKGPSRGLGLTNAAGILRAHKGAITLISAPGQGSTFEILLPILSAT